MGAIKPTLCMRGAGDLFLAVTGEISIPPVMKDLEPNGLRFWIEIRSFSMAHYR
jgi:hypothetical protein